MGFPKPRQLWSRKEVLLSPEVAMQIIHGRVESPLVVHSELEVRGTVAGSLRVSEAGDFVLRGVCEGDVVIEAGARAEIWGIVEGNLINRGGRVCLFGIVQGYSQRIDGQTSVSCDSVVRKGFRS